MISEKAVAVMYINAHQNDYKRSVSKDAEKCGIDEDLLFNSIGNIHKTVEHLTTPTEKQMEFISVVDLVLDQEIEKELGLQEIEPFDRKLLLTVYKMLIYLKWGAKEHLDLLQLNRLELMFSLLQYLRFTYEEDKEVYKFIFHVYSVFGGGEVPDELFDENILKMVKNQYKDYLE